MPSLRTLTFISLGGGIQSSVIRRLLCLRLPADLVGPPSLKVCAVVVFRRYDMILINNPRKQLFLLPEYSPEIPEKENVQYQSMKDLPFRHIVRATMHKTPITLASDNLNLLGPTQG